MNLIVDNLDTRVKTSGGGLVVLMLHGWKDSLETFDYLAENLQRDYKIVRIDFPGFGGSQASSEPWGSTQYADFIKRTLEKLDIDDVYAVVTHSMGSRVILNALGRKVLEIEKLVIISGAGVPNQGGITRSAWAAVARGGRVVASVLPKAQQRKLKKKLYGISGSDYLGAGELEETFKLIIAEDSRQYAPNVHAETLLMYSNNDKLTPLANGRELEELIPNAKLVMMGNLGHNMHKENPEKTLNVIKDFL